MLAQGSPQPRGESHAPSPKESLLCARGRLCPDVALARAGPPTRLAVPRHPQEENMPNACPSPLSCLPLPDTGTRDPAPGASRWGHQGWGRASVQQREQTWPDLTTPVRAWHRGCSTRPLHVPHTLVTTPCSSHSRPQHLPDSGPRKAAARETGLSSTFPRLPRGRAEGSCPLHLQLGGGRSELHLGLPGRHWPPGGRL